MDIVKQYKMMLFFSAIFFMPMISISGNMDVIKAIETSINGAKVIKVILSPLPHSTAMMMTIHTNKKQLQKIIISQNQVNIALTTLKNMNRIRGNTVFISNKITHSQDLTKTHLQMNEAKLSTPGAPAIISSTVISANQQASK